MVSISDVKKQVFKGLNLEGAMKSSAQITFTFEPTVAVAAGRLAAMAPGGSVREPLTQAVQKVIIPSIQRNFDVGGRPPWEPLSAGTMEARDALGRSGSSTPLNLTGALRSAMGNIGLWNINNSFAMLANLPDNVWYGKLHQAGYGGQGAGRRVQKQKGMSRADILDYIHARAARTKGINVVASIPARPFVMFQPEDEDAITEIFIKWWAKKMLKAWP